MPLDDVALVAGTQQNLSNLYYLDIYAFAYLNNHTQQIHTSMGGHSGQIWHRGQNNSF